MAAWPTLPKSCCGWRAKPPKFEVEIPVQSDSRRPVLSTFFAKRNYLLTGAALSCCFLRRRDRLCCCCYCWSNTKQEIVEGEVNYHTLEVNSPFNGERLGALRTAPGSLLLLTGAVDAEQVTAGERHNCHIGGVQLNFVS